MVGSHLSVPFDDACVGARALGKGVLVSSHSVVVWCLRSERQSGRCRKRVVAFVFLLGPDQSRPALCAHFGRRPGEWSHGGNDCGAGALSRSGQWWRRGGEGVCEDEGEREMRRKVRTRGQAAWQAATRSSFVRSSHCPRAGPGDSEGRRQPSARRRRMPIQIRWSLYSNARRQRFVFLSLGVHIETQRRTLRPPFIRISHA
jgi:hypothetical protein